MSDSVFLHGIALANFRGIAEEVVRVGPFQRFNFFIGPNNSGKSTVLNYIAQHLKSRVSSPSRSLHRNETIALDPLDANVNAKGPVVMGIGVPAAKALARYETVFQGQHMRMRASYLASLKYLLSLFQDGELLWFQRGADQQKPLLPIPENRLASNDAIARASSGDLQRVWSALTGHSGGGPDHWAGETIARLLSDMDVSVPAVALIPAIREVSERGQEFSDWSGKGLIEELARHQNPDYAERAKTAKFEAINDFIRAVTDNSSARIEIPYERQHILVHMDGKVLPLRALGTGIHEVVMLAAACTLLDSQIVCIEEPEIHLHPLLQRRLIQYLAERTSNQYFIATHSAGIIDATDAAVFHVSSNDGMTRITPALTSASKFEICKDLGYRASDILQTNAIVWVEGPSDRIYLRHWIAKADASLREGTDYSIMFYGGRLLSHLSAAENDAVEDGQDLEALIEVRQLNRHLCVVIDSDRQDAAAPINATKQRVVAELSQHGGIGWITDGREIENYVAKDLMTGALQEVYGERFGQRLRSGQFEHVLPFQRSDGKHQKDVDKVAVARAVCKRPADLDVLDLRARVTELVGLILSARGH